MLRTNTLASSEGCFELRTMAYKLYNPFQGIKVGCHDYQIRLNRHTGLN